ncbi:hsp70-binding protein 1-like isoform X1 [Eriocheir sinensis]|uniref:hsp70-binding protein 1-like isoform X1 n=2 Tax=Eriocheir sinensis TaxID=95602 RepID=UPI0021C6E4A4|nr:hsp70-binding protein 1-like isoform X1 [Eriocheir sinensis]
MVHKFSTMSDDGRGQTPRQPRNLQGLLNFCTEITAREDTTQPTSIQHLDPERRRFLEEALNSLTVNVAKQLAESVKSLCCEAVTMGGEDVTEQEEAIAMIEEHADDMNYAIDLYKMGAFPVFVRCLDSPHSSLRVGAAGLIGDVCQNNLQCQQSMITLNVVPQLLHMVDGDEDINVRVKALYALSCLIRDFPDGEKEFMKAEGFSYLMRAMQSGVEKLVVKSAFLLSRLIQGNDSYKAELLSMGYVEQLFTILSNEETDNISREHCTAALLSLASSYPPALAECMRPELHLNHLLTTRLKEIKAKQELQEEEGYISELLKLMERPEADGEENSCR